MSAAENRYPPAEPSASALAAYASCMSDSVSARYATRAVCARKLSEYARASVRVSDHHGNVIA